MAESEFTIEYPADSGHKSESIKWTCTNTRYEITIAPLQSFNIGKLLPHVLLVKDKVRTVVTNQFHIGESLFTVLPRTLSSVLQGVWNQVRADAPNQATDVANFEARLHEFIAVHATEEDRRDLFTLLRSVHKPRSMPTQEFWYRLRELNTQGQWLPGAAAALTDDEIRQAYYNGMPAAWKYWFLTAGHSVEHQTIAQLARYFRVQEKQADRKQAENQSRQ